MTHPHIDRLQYEAQTRRARLLQDAAHYRQLREIQASSTPLYRHILASVGVGMVWVGQRLVALREIPAPRYNHELENVR